MSTIPIFSLETIPAAHVSDTMLEQAAGLFSAAYGVWSAEAAERMGRRYCKQGTRVKMTPLRLRDQCLAPGTNSVFVRAMAGSSTTSDDDEDSKTLVGYAFATSWMYGERCVCWVTQLCVEGGYRRQGLATKILSRLREESQNNTNNTNNIMAFSILSSHPAAIMAALRAWGRGIEAVDIQFAKNHAAGIMAASPVAYVRDAKLKGSIFGIHDHDNEDGAVCCADTKFWVDHAEPLTVLAEVKANRNMDVWPFGELPPGCEFLALC